MMGFITLENLFLRIGGKSNWLRLVSFGECRYSRI